MAQDVPGRSSPPPFGKSAATKSASTRGKGSTSPPPGECKWGGQLTMRGKLHVRKMCVKIMEFMRDKKILAYARDQKRNSMNPPQD